MVDRIIKLGICNIANECRGCTFCSPDRINRNYYCKLYNKPLAVKR